MTLLVGIIICVCVERTFDRVAIYNCLIYITITYIHIVLKLIENKLQIMKI